MAARPTRAERLAARAYAAASAALAGRGVPSLPDWIHPSVVRALWLPLPGGGEPVLGVALRAGVPLSALPTNWQLPGTGERLPLRVRPQSQACAQRLPTLSRAANAEFEGSATALLQDRLGPQRYLLTCAHVAAADPGATSGDLIRVSGGAFGTAELRQWQPVLDEGAFRTPIDAAVLKLDDTLFRTLQDEGSLLPSGVGGPVVAEQRLTLRQRGGDVGGRALIFWSGFVDIPGLTPGVADYFLERGIGYRSAISTRGGDSGAAVWDTERRLVGMHLAGLEATGLDEANAVFGAIQPVLDWFRVSPVLQGGAAMAPPASLPGLTRSAAPGDNAAGLSDRQVVAATLWGEARNQDDLGLRAVACVIANRARTRYRRCRSAREVCLDRWQFSCWNAGDPNLPKLLRTALRPDREFERALIMADEVLANMLTDITTAARHYHTSRIAPTWARGKTPCAVFGDHLFYNDVA